jgi:hypothetical protein
MRERRIQPEREPYDLFFAQFHKRRKQLYLFT